MELLKTGQRSRAVHKLQDRLTQLGFQIDDSERGGLFGASTQAAVRELQQRRGLNVDGIVGGATWRELVESGWKLGDRPLLVADPLLRGDDIRDLQSRLNGLGFGAGKHDGIFGLRTEMALKDFQRNLAVGEDGIAGPETVAALDRLRMVLRTELGPRTRERAARQSSPRGIKGKRVALDPGHGGDDPGEAGPSGETEAEVAFLLAALLGRMLEERGAIVMLTRGPIENPSESERTKRSNDFEADLFVSIHLNAHPSEVAMGAATYYFEREGVASEPGEHLADIVQTELVSIGSQDCRSHGKAYPILLETRMPAILVEPGFITNPDEAKMLGDQDGATQVLASLASAVERYFSE
ncbi:MAG TPA: N-acetylmuramoyl-L-alanine amidase [Actinomycetota bacterium]|nr:N-acetylmuramoyl-L-alanine amidase [Actinomycetota bacterium]